MPGEHPLPNLLDKPAAVIVDIDGTLSDASHRQDLVRGPKKNFDKFYDLCHLDEPHDHICNLVNLLSPTYKIVLVSGRVERTRAATVAWLRKHYVTHDALYMRPDGDFRADDVLKAEILDRDILPNFTPIMAFDDRDRVVAMWRRCGIPCLQVAEGNF